MKTLTLLITILFACSCSWSKAGTWTQKADFGGSACKDAVGFSIDSFGYIGTGNGNGSSFWQYHPSSDVWTQKADFGGGQRAMAVGFSIGSKGYVGTGYWTEYEKDFWEYNPIANLWTQKANFPGHSRAFAVGF